MASAEPYLFLFAYALLDGCLVYLNNRRTQADESLLHDLSEIL